MSSDILDHGVTMRTRAELYRASMEALTLLAGAHWMEEEDAEHFRRNLEDIRNYVAEQEGEKASNPWTMVEASYDPIARMSIEADFRRIAPTCPPDAHLWEVDRVDISMRSERLSAGMCRSIRGVLHQEERHIREICSECGLERNTKWRRPPGPENLITQIERDTPERDRAIMAAFREWTK